MANDSDVLTTVCYLKLEKRLDKRESGKSLCLHPGIAAVILGKAMEWG